MLKKLLTTLVATICALMPVMSVSADEYDDYWDPIMDDYEYEEPEYTGPFFVANEPTEITITKIDPANNKIWVKFADDGKTSGIPNKYTKMIFLGIGANDRGMMSDEMLSYFYLGQDTLGTPMVRLENTSSYITKYSASSEPYEFTTKYNIKDSIAEWYYWAVTSSNTWSDQYIVRGRIDFSACLNSAAFHDGMTCEAETTEEGKLFYGLYDEEGNRVEIPELAEEDEEDSNSEPTVIIKEVIVEKEVIKEVPVEVIKEVPVEVIKEVPVEVIKEVITEVPVEVVKEIVKEVPVEVIKEVVKEMPVETVKEVIKEVPVETIREVIREVPVETIKEIIKEVPVEVIKEVVKEAEKSSDDENASEGDVNVEVPQLGGFEEKTNHFDYWWVLVALLVIGGIGGLCVLLKDKKEKN